MAEFVDPRENPTPPASAPAQRTARLDDLKELHSLCHQGRLYEVERWIAEGRPLQLEPGVKVHGRRVGTALEIALDDGNQALALLLLSNGYAPHLEQSSPLDIALEGRRVDMVDLLLAWGADPQSLDPDYVFATYSTDLLERFWTLGVDYTGGHALAQALSDHTSNKPLFGWCKRHAPDDPKIQMELNVALVHHAEHGNEKGTQLCLWAGADHHVPAPVLRWWRPGDDDLGDDDVLRRSAVEAACHAGHVEILKRLGPDPTVDDFDELYRWAYSGAVVDVLARHALPTDMDVVIHHLIWGVGIGFDRSWRYRDVAEKLFAVGARWRRSSPEGAASFRRSLLGLKDHDLIEWMRLLAQEDYCAPEILAEIARTPSIRRRMKEVGFIPGGRDRRGNEIFRPTRSREVLKRFGVELPKRKVEERLPRTVRIGTYRRDGQELRLTRQELFERVWATPVATLATEWGLSDRGLAKACKRLQIPLPPRGYWAKLRAGQKLRRSKLPAVPVGRAEEVIVQLC